MSLYHLHRCVWDFVRAGGISDGEYQLTDEERQAFERRDPAALYRLGLHPMLLHSFCRALGYRRDEYRELLVAEQLVAEQLVAAQPAAESGVERTGRWQR